MLRLVIVAACILASLTATRADYARRVSGNWIFSGADDSRERGGSYSAILTGAEVSIAFFCVRKRTSVIVIAKGKALDLDRYYVIRIRVDEQRPIVYSDKPDRDRVFEPVTPVQKDIFKAVTARTRALTVQVEDEITHETLGEDAIPLTGSGDAMADVIKNCEW
jgi:hypothetical protein